MKRLLTQTLMSALLVTGFSLQGAAPTAPTTGDIDLGAAINAVVKQVKTSYKATKTYVAANKTKCAIGTAVVATVIAADAYAAKDKVNYPDGLWIELAKLGRKSTIASTKFGLKWVVAKPLKLFALALKWVAEGIISLDEKTPTAVS